MRGAQGPDLSRSRGAGTAAALVVSVLLTSACTADPPAREPQRPAQVEAVDLSGLPVRRAPFCDRIDMSETVAALGGPAVETDRYSPGDVTEIVPGVVDRAHEYDCTFEAASGVQARAWIFAEPVGVHRAHRLVREAARGRGCRVRETPVQFGAPSVTTWCRENRPRGQSVSLHGLFGDSWVSCRLFRPGGARPRSRSLGSWTRQWCVDVAAALGARP
jgi:hypothetical protein